MRTASELDVVLQAARPALVAGRRQINGYYPASQLGRAAADGSLLDSRTGDHVIASAWRDPACELLQCFRARVARMVPRIPPCQLHGRRPITGEDPFPLEGEEWRTAEAAAWQTLAPKLGILPRDRHASFAACRPTPALEVARAVCDPENDTYLSRAVFMEGNPGSGKSTAIACTVRDSAIGAAANLAGIDHIRVYTFPELTRRLLHEDTRDETLEVCCEAPELYLDDVGAGHVKADGFVVHLFEEIIIAREGARAPMLASTNLAPRRFRDLFGERVFDRIKGEWGAWFNVDTPSLRRRPGSR